MDEHILVLCGLQGDGEVTETAHHPQDVTVGGPINLLSLSKQRQYLLPKAEQLGTRRLIL